MEYRNLFVPADDLEKLAAGYLPLSHERFAALVKSISGAREQDRTSRPRIERGLYWARLENGVLEAGEAAWEAVYTGPTETLLPLGDSNLALSSLRWQGNPPREAKAALVDGRSYAAAIDRSGVLRANWTRQGEIDEQGGVSFGLRLPAAALHELILDLPSDFVPACESAVIEPGDKHSPMTGVTIPGENLPPGRKLWTIRALPRGELRLHLARGGAAGQGTRLRQESSYLITPREGRLTAAFRFDVIGSPLEELWLDLDERLALSLVRCGETPLTVAAVEKEGGAGGVRKRVKVRFAEPLAGLDRVVHAEAIWSPDFQRSAPLPSLLLTGPEWQEGTTSLRVLHPLVVQRIEVGDGRQTGLQPLVGDEPGELWEFQSFRPQCKIEALVGRPSARTKIAQGATLEFAPSGESASVQVEVSVAAGEISELGAETSSAWIVDAVDCSPVELLAGWTTQPAAPGKQKLLFSWNRPLTAARGARLAIRAHRLAAAPGVPLAADQLAVVDFPGVESQDTLLLLRADSPWRLGGPPRAVLDTLDNKQLSDEQRRLIDPRGGGLLLRADTARRTPLLLLPAEQRFSAQLSCEIALRRGGSDTAAGQVAQTLRIRCQPESGGLESVVVFVSAGADEPFNWSLADDPAAVVKAHRIDPARPESSDRGVGETWELTLPRPRLGAFELVAQRTVPLAARMPAPLCAVPAAASQTGVLTVRMVGPSLPKLTTRGIRPLPPTGPSAPGETVAAFRYDPFQDPYMPEAAAAISARDLLPGDSLTTGRCWAWSSRQVTRFGGDGQGLHRARFLLENAGRNELGLSLPEGCKLQRVLLDRSVVIPSGESAGDWPWRIRLDPESRFLCLTVEFTSPAVSWPTWGTRTVPLLRIDAPLLAHSLRVEPPALLQISTADRTAIHTEHEKPNGSDARFNPLRSAEWLSLLGIDRKAGSEQKTALVGLTALAAAAADGPQSASWGEIVRAADQTAESSQPPTARIWVDDAAVASAGLSAKVRCPLRAAPPRELDHQLSEAGLAAVVIRDRFVLTTVSRLLDGGADVQRLGGFRAVYTSRAGTKRGSAEEWGPLSIARDWAATEPRPLWPAGPEGDAEPAAGLNSQVVWELVSEERSELKITVWKKGFWMSAAWIVLGIAVLPGIRLARKSVWRLAAILLVLMLLSVVLGAPLAPLTLLMRGAAWGLGVGAVIVSGARTPLAGRFGASSWLSSKTPAFAAATLVSVALWFAWVADDARANAAADTPGKAAPPGVTDNPAKPSGPPKLDGIAPGPGPDEAPRRGAGETKVGDGTGQSETLPHAAPSGGVQRVLIPVDSARKPVGEYLYVSREFYELLHRQGDSNAPPAAVWLLRSANYRAELRHSADQTRLELDSLQATLGFETLRPGVTVELPFSKAAAELAPSGAQLDGRPVSLEWSSDLRSLRCVCEEAGKHQLELALRPRLGTFDEETGFDLAIPALPDATLVCQMPENATGVRVPKALGGTRSDLAQGRSTTDLGPTSLLSIRWPKEPGEQITANDLDADQYYWLQVREGAVTLRWRTRVTPRRGNLRELTARADPRLRPLPLAADQPYTLSTVESRGRKQWTIRFKEPRTSESVIDLAFLLEDASGVGRLAAPLPKWDLLRHCRSSLAWTLADELEVDSKLPAAGGSGLLPAQFQSLWGAGGAVAPAPVAPAGAVRLSPGDLAWPLWLRTRPAAVQASERSTLVYAPQSRLEYEFALPADARPVYTVELPAGWKVRRVTTLVHEEPVESRWTQREGDLLVVLPTVAPGRRLVRLEAVSQTQPEGSFDCLLPRLLGVASTAHEVALYRREGVPSVDVEAVGLTPVEGDAAVRDATYDAARGRLVGRFTRPPLKPGTPPPALKLRRANSGPRQIHAQLLTVVQRVRDGWSAAAEMRLQIKGDVVDQLDFELPADWAAGGVVADYASAVVSAATSADRRRLTLIPGKPLTGEARVVFRLRLDQGSGETTRAPRITPLGLADCDETLVLPSANENRQIRWETRALRIAPLPKIPADLVEQRGERTAYRPLGSEYSASVRAVEQRGGQPRVILQDNRLSLQADGGQEGVALYYLDPAGADGFVVRLPPAVRLLRVASQGANLYYEAVREGEVRVQLGGGLLPQRLELAYAAWPLEGGPKSDAQQRRGSWAAVAPVAAEWPTDQTLWTIAAPTGARLHDGSISSPSPIPHQVRRLQSLADSLRAARRSAAEQSAADLRNWLAPWADEYVALRRDLLRREEWLDSDTLVEVGDLTEQCETLAAPWGGLSPRTGDHGGLTAVALQFSAPEKSRQTILLGAAPGGGEQLAIDGPPAAAESASLWPLWMAILALGGVFVGAIRVARPVREFFIRRPAAAGAICGGWLWLLSPLSFAGFAILAGSLVVLAWNLGSALRQGAGNSREPAAGAAVSSIPPSAPPHS